MESNQGIHGRLIPVLCGLPYNYLLAHTTYEYKMNESEEKKIAGRKIEQKAIIIDSI